MADEARPGGETSLPPTGGEPGTLSRLLLEIAKAPEEDLSTSWRESLKPGETVGRYQVREEIGRGGFGAVYEAFDPELGRAVALKTLRPGRPGRELTQDWVKREAEAIARLDHPCIVTVFDVGTCPAGPYLVMERLQGETLAKRLEMGPLALEEALHIAEDMARALAHAHHRGVLHRDLKPANVFLTDDGRVKLLDFGLAHLLGQEGGSGGGTPAYMAPEQARGETVDERADVYAAGMVLAEMLTGERPAGPAAPAAREVSSGSRTHLLWPDQRDLESARATGPDSGSLRVPGSRRVPRPVARILSSSLATDPSGRPRDGSAWLEALQGSRRALERPRIYRRVAVLGGGFLVLGLAIAGLATWRVWERQIPGGRPTVAVADFVNETGEKELDSISTLLITALEQSAQLRVLTRSRMLDVLHHLGKGGVERVDEPLAREVGREAGARALLLASIRRLGDAYVVEMRALDPLHDEYLFTVSDRASGKGAVFDLVDRLGTATRTRLGVAPSRGAPTARIASITTTNVKAWELISRSRQAIDRLETDEAKKLALEALAEDPGSALAHYQVALAAWWANDETPEGDDEARLHLDAASRLSDHLPDKERRSLLALRASVERRWDEALRSWDELAETYPLDKEASLGAGTARYRMGRSADAAPWALRAIQLDPGYIGAISLLARAVEEEPDALADWMRERAAGTKDGRLLRQFARGLLAADREEDAVAILQSASFREKWPWPQIIYPVYLADRGRGDEAEALLETALAGLGARPAGDPERANVQRPDIFYSPSVIEPERASLYRWGLFYAQLAQGRTAKARKTLGGMELPPQGHAYEELELATVRGAAAVAAAASLARERGVRPAFVAFAASVVGDLDVAGRFASEALAARELEWQGGLERSQNEALAAWARGSLDVASRLILEQANYPNFNVRYYGRFWLGLIELQRGSCRTAIDHWEQARNVRWPPSVGTAMPPWVGDRYKIHPSLLHHLASCYERTGDLPKARERNAEMLRLWARADPDLPLLVEAKALKARLEAR